MQLPQKAVKNVGTSSSITYLKNLCENGQLNGAMQAVEYTCDQQIPISAGTIMCLVEGCTRNKDFEAGRRLYKLMVRSGLGSNTFLCDHLIRLFALCENITEARIIFESVAVPTIFTWNSFISACVKLGKSEEALAVFGRMVEEGACPTKVTYLYLMKACKIMESRELGRLIHGQIVSCGFDSDVAIASTLIDMHCKCRSLEDAVKVFDKLSYRNAVSWGALISGHIHCGLSSDALKILEKMELENIEPDSHTLSCILKACNTAQTFHSGKAIHNYIIKRDLISDLVIQNSLLDMYAKCGGLNEAQKVFVGMPRKNVVSWGAMISAFVQHSHGVHALKLFSHMQKQGVPVNDNILTCILKACGLIEAVDLGMLLHQHIIESEYESNVAVVNALIDMYSKCFMIREACSTFITLPNRNIISWGALIFGYVQQGLDFCAIELFEEMQCQGMVPDKVLFLCILKACKASTFADLGWGMHDEIIRNSFDGDEDIRITLVNMYATCDRLDDAQKVFDGSTTRDVILWSIMIDGYVQQGLEISALDLFARMQRACINPDKYVFTCTLKACSGIGALLQGRLVHDLVLRYEIERDVVVGSSLVDMYTCCGSVEEAHCVLTMLPKRNEVSWGTIIAGYAQQGDCMGAVECLEEMQKEGLELNGVVFSSILAACSRAGLLEEGLLYFNFMQHSFGMLPSIPHYTCVIDLFSRTGHVFEAEALLKTMPFSPGSYAWASAISACKTYNNVHLATHFFGELVRENPKEASGYVIMSDVFAGVQMWDDVNKVEELKYCTGVRKKAGISCIELNEDVHEFQVGDAKHGQCEEIITKLERLGMQVKGAGYMPNLDLVVDRF